MNANYKLMQISKALNSILPFIGLIDSMYLLRIRSNPSTCEVSETSFSFNIDCGAVATSEYSVFIGIPLALWGIIYYIFLIFLFSLDPEKEFNVNNYLFKLKNIILAILTVAFIFSLYLIYLQIVVIESICVYCMISAIVTTILFTIAIKVNFYN